MKTVVYNIEGMTCSGCTGSLEKLLLAEPGIEAATASFETDRCEVSLDPASVSDEDIAAIVDKAGFTYHGRVD